MRCPFFSAGVAGAVGRVAIDGRGGSVAGAATGAGCAITCTPADGAGPAACTTWVTGFPRRMISFSSPFCQTRRVTSEASTTSTICRSASTSSDVFPKTYVPFDFFLSAAMEFFRSARGDAREVLAVAGVDLEDVALVDEERNVDGVAGLERRGLH